MSCPLGYKPKREVEVALPDDVSGNHIKLMAAFNSLLPKCSDLSTKLDECREKVAASPSGGSCLDDSRKWMGCFNRRSKLSRAIVETCGGEDLSSHGELQEEYIECMSNHDATKTISMAEQNLCLEPLQAFLLCATHVVES